MPAHQLRPYQYSAKQSIRKLYMAGTKKVLLHLPTGGGKTTIFADIMKDTAARKKKIVMVVRGRKLVDQAHKRLQAQGVPHGVMMANHWAVAPLEPVQVCSIDTLNARGIYPPADLVVIDEAHYAISKSFHTFMSHYEDAYVLAVTATPYVNKSLRHIADEIVKPTDMDTLIQQGFLVPAVSYGPTEVDTSGLKVSRSTGDYKTSDLEELLDDNKFIANLTSNWLDFAEQRPTLCFAVSVKHSEEIVASFNAIGVPAEHCDANTPEKERNAIIERLEYGQTKLVSNVGIFCTGVDIPKVSCILMARPTASYNLFIQQAGRGTRPAPGKHDFILLDCAGNVRKHGFITDEPLADLDGAPEKNTLDVKTCQGCFAIVPKNESICPMCKMPFTKDGGGGGSAKVEESSEIKIGRLLENPEEKRARETVRKLQETCKKKGYKPGWVYHRMVDEFGETVAKKYCSRSRSPDWLQDVPESQHLKSSEPARRDVF